MTIPPTNKKRQSIGRAVRIGLTLLGVLMIVVALLVDVVMGGLSGGIGPLQITVALFGLMVALISWIPFSMVGRILIAVMTIIVMIFILEMALSFAGFEPEYRSPANFDPQATVDLQFDETRVCDEVRGCHWNVELLRERCLPDAENRTCRINEYGLSSVYEFNSESLPDDAYRILVLGDSFTWGASADYGQGWVDIMERGLQSATDVVVWNAAMPGTGTSQALITAENLLPILQPDLVILGFHTGNDFADNFYPYDRFMNVMAADGSSIPVQQYSLDAAGHPFQETDAVIHARANGYTVKSITSWQARLSVWLRRTRLGTLLVGAYRVITWDAHNIPPTAHLLNELQARISEQGSAFFVLIIPEESDALIPGQKYQAGLSVLGNTHIPYVDSLPELEVADFQNENPANKHLNNAGHGKVGQMMTLCVQQFIETGTLDCDS